MSEQATFGESRIIGGGQQTQNQEALSSNSIVGSATYSVSGADENSASVPALRVGRGYYDWVNGLMPLSDEEKATLKAHLVRYEVDENGLREFVLWDKPEVRRAIRLPDEPEARR